MLNIHPQELLLILLVALLVVGPRRLPELGRSIGKGIREIRKAQDEVRKTIQVNLDDDDDRRPTFGESTNGPRRTPNGKAAAAAAGSAATNETTREVSRTLGRGLAEIRRARSEIERSFRVDMDAPTRPRRSSPSSRANPRRLDGAAESVPETTPQVTEGEDTGGEPETPQSE